MSVWEAAAEPQRVGGLGAAAVKALERFMQTMAELRERALEDGPVAELLEAVLGDSGYLQALEAERTIEAQGRIENLEQLIEVGREFDTSPERAVEQERALDSFLQQIALIADADSRREGEPLITLMTLHNAKGLEYPIVFVVGCEDGVFPHSRALDEGALEEERRLFYVGITRAMRELYLTYARSRTLFGARAQGLASRFLGEIPDELTDVEDAFATGTWREGGRAGAGRRGHDALRPGSARAHRGTNGASAWAAAQAEPGARGGSVKAFRLGEDVVHASFGEGVVTALEPEGVIVVRFAADGSERKLMAEYAPVQAARP
jgi:DNA helicase-2/ATP-dependent DNA helicase PcrA